MGRKRSNYRWLTRHQLEVMDQIANNGRRGVPLFESGFNLSTIKSLVTRQLLDTRSGGKVRITRAGKKRLRQPWPEARSDHGDSDGSASADSSGRQTASEDLSGP